MIFSCTDILPGQGHITDKEIEKQLISQNNRTSVKDVRALIHKAKIWKIKTINVKFLEGLIYEKTWVEKVVKEDFEPFVGLTFNFQPKESDDEHILITFRKNKGTYSYIGTDCLNKKTEETMNFAWIDPPKKHFKYKGKLYRVPSNASRNGNTFGASILHEFGHVIGLVHEHKHPTHSIKWDLEKVYEKYKGAPNFWKNDKIKSQFIDRYDEEEVNGTAYDKDSIMLYFFPPDMTTDGMYMKANHRLSPKDKEIMLKHYPK